MKSFHTLGLSPALERALVSLGFSQMTQIQEACIPLLLKGHDLIGQSKTGSGKTAAFVIPILQKIDLNLNQPQVLILCPTRELCNQVLQECHKFSSYIKGLQMTALIGGQPYLPQTSALTKGVQLIVGTPGRTLELINKGKLDLINLNTLVLDEADRLLEKGFFEEMKAILDKLPKQRQTIFFSATYPEGIKVLSQVYQSNAKIVSITESSDSPPAIEQCVYFVEKTEKTEALMQILKNHPSMCTLIFCRTKAAVNEIGAALKLLKASSQILHADLKQTERDRAVTLFRHGSLRILVATDVAARGLDIETLQLVINYDLPPTADTYLHRIGRTGRAGRSGIAISLATDFEAELISDIEKVIGEKIATQALLALDPMQAKVDLRKTLMRTIQISAGKTEKLTSKEIALAITGSPQPFPTSAIGRIDILDRISYVSITPAMAENIYKKLRAKKFKGLILKMILICNP